MPPVSVYRVIDGYCTFCHEDDGHKEDCAMLIWKKEMSKLTPENIEHIRIWMTPAILFCIKKTIGGADVFSRIAAKKLREVDAHQKAGGYELIEIVGAMSSPAPSERQPYFGCITTPLGEEVVKMKFRL